MTKRGSRTACRFRSWNEAGASSARGAISPASPHPRGPWRVCAYGRRLPIPQGLDPPPSPVEHTFVPPAGRPYLAKEEIEQLRRSIAMLQPGAMAMKREDAMRLLGDLGEVQGRLDKLRHGLRALLEEGD